MWKIFAALAFGISGCAADPATAPVDVAPRTEPCSSDVIDPARVSLAALLAEPKRFEGQPVAVIGFLHRSFEHSAIYLHREDYAQGIAPNGLWVTGATIPDALNDRYARLEGIFTATERGHLSQWSGTLCNIGRATPWGRDEP
ncbi:hypothetical protein GCM10028862_02940 [Luteimonas pelagia]